MNNSSHQDGKVICPLCKKEAYKGKLKLVEDIEMCYICYARLIEMGEI